MVQENSLRTSDVASFLRHIGRFHIEDLQTILNYFPDYNIKTLTEPAVPVLKEIVPEITVCCSVEDKLMVRIERDGGLQALKLVGLLTLRISDEKYGKVTIHLDINDQRGIKFLTHPDIDKELFRSKSQIALINPAKPFPMNTDNDVLKWRYTTQEESAIPFPINWWPSKNGESGCNIDIEYELENTKLELQDVVIVIPLLH
jgi:hypothetical protein